MSRIGKMPVVLPNNVKASVQGDLLVVEGPKGKLSQHVDSSLSTKIEGGKIVFSISNLKDVKADAKHGLVRSIVANMVTGVTEGFKKDMEINGVGFRANVKGKELELSIGFSHQVLYPIPDGITIAVDKQTKLTISGCDAQLVGQTAAELRAMKKPEPYKGKGIKYAEEKIRRKAGKAAAGAGSA